MSAPTDIPALLREALTRIRELRAELADHEQAARAPIAIIGASCRFPGGVGNLEAFARVLRKGVDAVKTVPADRWDAEAYYHPDPDFPGKIVTREGAFLENIDRFDAEFFSITPREAEHLDPQQRLLLEVAWEALEDAANAPRRLSGSRTGVFTGLMCSDFAMRALRENGLEGIDAYLGTGGALSAAAGRLAYVFGFQGPAMAVDTACSSSLVAVHLACQSLRVGECDLALAGGVNALLTPEPSINLSRARMLSPHGRCRTFDAAADGYVRGEGCGIVVLKPLARARADGDRILGVIRGSAVNQDGRSSGLTAPNGQAQQALLRAALRAAGVQPEDIGYVECHGSGTPLGDPIEVHALREVLGRGRPADRMLALGSVKTNFGHLEGAAGICGLLKALLVVRGGEVFPHLHLEKLNPSIDFDGVPMAIPTSSMPWFTNGGSRIAGVSSFGFVGTNVHVIVESPPGDEQMSAGAADEASVAHVLTLSTRSKPALQELARRHSQWLEEHPQVELASVARTLNAGRNHFENRAALIASSAKEAVDGLHALARGVTPAGAVCGQAPAYERRSLAFMFTGQGAQHPGMGRKLAESEPVFRDALRRCEEALEPRLPRPLMELLFFADEETLNETAVAQPALFALEYALTELWASWGVRPDFLLGHSLGEFVAACVAGIFSFEDALRLVVERGRLIQALPRGGKMAAVLAGEAEVLPVLARREDKLAIAAFNAPGETVLSGAEVELEEALADLARSGVTTCKLRASHAFHSPLMRPVLTEFEEVLTSVTFSPPKKPIANTVTGALDTTHAMAQPEYWLQQLVSPVRLRGSVAAIAAAGAGVFLEVGPRPVLAPLGSKIIPDSALTWLWSLRGPREDGMTPLRSAARLYAAGVEFDWDAMHAHRGGRKISLPTYPFQRRRFWLPAVRKERATVRSFEPGQAVKPPPAQESAHSVARVDQSANLQAPTNGIRFSVMFFAATQNPMDGDKYRLVLEAARFADRHGFASVWVPERHFTNMGSLYPNPAVLHAALARETRRVRLMAGSVVAPLHHPIRLAEEWAMVDNLSGGRVGLSFASGWNPDDFAFFPERYAGRRESLYEALAIVRQLWRGEEIEITNGVGRRTRVRIFPTPLQKELPFWITAAGNPQTFQKAGELGANLLTHLLDQDLTDLAEKIRLYREARAMHGHDPAAGCVTIMVHTFIGHELAATQEAVRVPFCNYLKASRGLLTGLAQSRGHEVDVASLSEGDLDDLVKFLFERFASTRALLGTPASCEQLVRRLVAVGVNEIASLLDFGQKVDDVIGGLPWLRMLKERVESSPGSAAADAPLELTRHRPLAERELPSEWFYELVWRPLPPPTVMAESRQGRWLIFADNGGFSARLATVLGFERCVFVRYGPHRSGDPEFWVDSNQSDGVSSFFREHGPEIADVTGVIFLWPLDTMRTDELEAASLAGSQCLTVEGVRQLVQGLVEAAPGKALAVWWITCGATQKAPVEHALAVAQAPLLGFARGVSLEHPEWRCGVVDLDPLASAEANAALLAAHVSAADHEDKVAFRGGALWGERLVRMEPPAMASQRWKCRADAAYLITGGLGGVGLRLAEWLVERGARHLLLVGRSSPSPAAQRAIESLQANGSTVMVSAADVVDEMAMTSLLQNWRKAGRPPIRGVMHAAGLWHDVPVDRMDAATLAAVLAPKMTGTWVLERVLADQALDFFVSFSSLSSLWPAFGQTNYAAANAFLDAHGLWRRNTGRHALSVNWGPWADVGFGATKEGLRAHERLEAFGLQRLPPSDALDALGWLLARDLTQGVVVKMDWAMLARVDPRLAHTPLLSEMTSRFPEGPSITAPDSDLVRHLELAPSAEHPALVQGAVASIAARVLHIGPGELRVDEPLRNLGLDSLMAVEIKNRLQAETGVNVPLARFLEGVSVAALALWVQTEIKLSRLNQTEGPGAETTVVEELAL